MLHFPINLEIKESTLTSSEFLAKICGNVVKSFHVQKALMLRQIKIVERLRKSSEQLLVI